MPRCEAEPQIKDQARRHARERYALEEAERAGQLIAGEFEDEGREQKRRHEVQRDDVEEDDDVGGHDAARTLRRDGVAVVMVRARSKACSWRGGGTPPPTERG